MTDKNNNEDYEDANYDRAFFEGFEDGLLISGFTLVCFGAFLAVVNRTRLLREYTK